MKKFVIASTCLVLAACGGSNSDGSSKTTYSSCKITDSKALFAEDRSNDLKQCWNAKGDGYESQGDALQWCKRTVGDYISSTYLIGHTVEYAVESTYCPK